MSQELWHGLLIGAGRQGCLVQKMGQEHDPAFLLHDPWVSICPCNTETIDTLTGIHPYPMHMLVLAPSISILNQVAETNSGPMVLLKVNS